MYEDIAEHLMPWLQGAWAPPYRIHIFPTDRCNLRCRSCWRWSVNPEGNIPWAADELSDEKLLEIVEEAAELGTKEIELSGGGEPFLRGKTTLAVIKRIKELGLKGAVTTNGTLMTGDIAKLLVDIGWEQVIVSLDGPNAEINDFLRPPSGSFEKIIQSLQWIRDYKKITNKDKPLISIQCVVSKINVAHVAAMFELAVKYNVQFVVFDPLKVFSSKGQSLALSSQTDFKVMESQIAESKKIIDKYNIGTNLLSFLSYPELMEESGKLNSFLKTFEPEKHALDASSPEPALLSVCCYEPWYRIHINSLGNTTSCCLAEYSRDDNIKSKSLKDIWVGKHFSEFRRKILNKEFPACCANCNASLFAHSRSIQGKLKTLWHAEKQDSIQYNPAKNNVYIKSKSVQKLNVCLLSREYYPDTGWGGIGTYTFHLAHGLAEAGCGVHVICQSLDVDRDCDDNGVYVHRVSHKSYFPFKGRFREFGLRWEYSRSVYDKLREAIDGFNIDVVEAPNFSGEGFIYSFHKKTPLVTRLHTPFSEVINFLGWKKDWDKRLSCWFENTAILRSDLVICSTNSHAESIAREVGINQKKIKIIPLGIPMPDIEAEKHINARPLILFVGRLEKRKGAHVLIEAAPHIFKAIPEAEMVIIGRDSFITEHEVSFAGLNGRSFKEQLIKMIPDEYRDRIKFLGYVSNEELSEYYKKCDVFVAPSLYESFGLIYIEAMSYAKPVIGCGVGGVPEVIKDGITGILVPPQDVSRLASAVVSILKDRPRAYRLGRAGYEYARKHFSREEMVKNTIGAYVEVCQQKRK